jgi:hypothetical protein
VVPAFAHDFGQGDKMYRENKSEWNLLVLVCILILVLTAECLDIVAYPFSKVLRKARKINMLLHIYQAYISSPLKLFRYWT